MKLAVYAICKNEEKNVERFWRAIVPELRHSDELVIVDTGSTDGTLLKFRELIQNDLTWGTHDIVSLNQAVVTPWRFDQGRNVALAHVSRDVDACWSLDLDEVPQPGWRDAIERNWDSSLTRLRYKFIWSWNKEGTPGVIYYSDKLHARAGCSWRLPAHEYLKFDYRIEEQKFVDDLVVHHLADYTKERPNPLPLLELGLREEPNNDRNQHYLAREYFFNNRMVEASEMFQRHLANPNATWRHERSESMMYLAQTGGNEAWARQWLIRAVAECPERKETWMRWAEFENAAGNGRFAYELAFKATKLPDDEYYLSNPKYRNEGIWEFMNGIKQ